MIIAFENHFERHYEGGARWLHDVLAALGTLPEPPRCYVVGAEPGYLPSDLRGAAHVATLPWKDGMPSVENHDAAADDLLSDARAQLWIGRYRLPRLASGIPRLICWPGFGYRRYAHFNAAQVERAESLWRDLVADAEAILTISQTSADEALSIAPQVAERHSVCGYPPVFSASALAPDPQAVRRRYHLPDRFLIVCNQFWLHKNHALVVNALSVLRQQAAALPTIAFTGRPFDSTSPDAFGDLLRFVQREGLHDACRFLGVIRRDEQLALIRAANAVIQPSLYEGRGAIVEESTVLGTQVLCADLPINHELDAPGAVFFDPADPDALATLMQRPWPDNVRTTASILQETQALTAGYGRRLLDVCERALRSAGS